LWGTGCPNCATRVSHSLLALEDVYGVDMYLNMTVAEDSYASQKIVPTEFAAAIAKAGNDGRHESCASLVAME